MIFRQVKYVFKITWLFIRHSFVKDRPELWSWCFELAREKEGNWFNDKNLICFLLESAIKYENDDQLCAIYSSFKSSFQEEDFFKHHFEKMQEACKKENTPDTFLSKSGRIDWTE